MMYSLLVGLVKQYIQGLISTRELEEWIVGHMQDVLDSRDQQAIEMAETIDALLIERQERLFTEDELRPRLTSLIREPFAITDSSNVTITQHPVLSQNLHFTWAPESAAAGR